MMRHPRHPRARRLERTLAITAFLTWFTFICEFWALAFLLGLAALALFHRVLSYVDVYPLYLAPAPVERGKPWRRFVVTSNVRQHDGSWIVYGRPQW